MPSVDDCHWYELTVPFPSSSSSETAAVKTDPAVVVPLIEYVASPESTCGIVIALAETSSSKPSSSV